MPIAHLSNFNNYGIYRAFNFVQFVEHWMEEKQIIMVWYKIILIAVYDSYFDLYIFLWLINKIIYFIIINYILIVI